MRRSRTGLAWFFVCLLPASAGGQEPAAAATQPALAPAATPTPASDPAPVVTRHTVELAGRKLAYTATTGFMAMKDEEGKKKADVFFIAYTRDGEDEPAARPITFTFNGGPGSSSVWLHLGALGPKRVLMDEQGFPLPPPFRLAANEGSWLPFTDLVFIDPVLTGYSRPAPGEKKEQFHGLEEDVASVGDFIRLYTTRHRRWASPKFIAGESYGTTRAAGLAGYLQLRHGMYLNGLVLISSVLQFSTLQLVPGNDLPAILYLPAYTAAAWYHQKLPAALQARPLAEVVDEARRFAHSDYTLALARGSTLSGADRARIVARLAELTGLSARYLEDSDLRVPIERFVRELLRDQGRSAGRLDSRFTGSARDNAGEAFEFDPSMAAIRGPYTQAINDYLRRELGFESDLTSENLGGRVYPWNWGSADAGFPNVAETLRSGMTQNPFLHVLVASGYYDLATPFSATEYTFRHLGGDPELAERVTMTYYESGHMMYIHRPSLLKLRDDGRAFVERVVAAARQ